MSKLRLGPVVQEKPVKVSIEIPGSLAHAIGDYAAVHARLTGLATPLAPERIIPAMIERFIAGDREFGKLRRRL